uniref:Uncharacterized protein n=1 Tax=Kalanchoe fedtschenkoi TaxID=63787 RepID=A0A7N0UXG9_KALFE
MTPPPIPFTRPVLRPPWPRPPPDPNQVARSCCNLRSRLWRSSKPLAVGSWCSPCRSRMMTVARCRRSPATASPTLCWWRLRLGPRAPGREHLERLSRPSQTCRPKSWPDVQDQPKHAGIQSTREAQSSSEDAGPRQPSPRFWFAAHSHRLFESSFM